jgi:hypothetical protein
VLSFFIDSNLSSAPPRARTPRLTRVVRSALLLLLPLAGAPALAQSARSHLAVADPAHPTQPLVYRSAFDGPPLATTDPAPGNWAALNARVGQFKRGHIDILRQEDQVASTRPAPDTAPALPHGGSR